LLKILHSLKFIVEFQVTSLPISYFSIFKELCSVSLTFLRTTKLRKISESAMFFNTFFPRIIRGKTFLPLRFKNNCLLKADAKIKALDSILQIFSQFFL